MSARLEIRNGKTHLTLPKGVTEIRLPNGVEVRFTDDGEGGGLIEAFDEVASEGLQDAKPTAWIRHAHDGTVIETSAQKPARNFIIESVVPAPKSNEVPSGKAS